MTVSQRRIFMIGFILFVVLVYLLSPVLTPFLTGALIAYLGDPIVNYLVKFKFPRTLAVTIVFLIFSVILLILLLILVPMLTRQIVTLINKIPLITGWIQNTLLPWLHEYFDIEINFDLSQLQTALSTHLQQISNIAAVTISMITRSGLAIIAFIANLILIPVVAFYLMRDWHKVVAGVNKLLPRKQEPMIKRLACDCDEVVGAFLRGQLIVMLCLGITYTVGLFIIGLDLALLIGMISGLVSIVPYLGFIVGIVAATIAAFFQFHDWQHILYVVLVYGVGQSLESMFFTPVLVGDKIGLHPVAVIFAILAGGQLFGFVGILLALPVAAAIMVLVRYMRERYLSSDFYTEVADDNEELLE